MSQQHCIVVGPVEGGGWQLDCDMFQAPMMFLSGGRAEAQARALARRLSDAGDEVELIVRDRAQVVVGSARFSGLAGF
jgi:hypothetical protein